MLNKLLDKLSAFKTNFGRATTYLGMINFVNMIFVVITLLIKEWGMPIPMSMKWLAIYVFICILMTQVIGIIDRKSGVMKGESKRLAKQNPYFDDIVSRLERIEEKLNKDEKEKVL